MNMYWKACMVLTLALFVQVHAQSQRRKLGGWNEINEDSQGVQSALSFAKEEFNRNSNDGYIININRTIKLMRQVVSGSKYRMEVEVTMSSCNNDDTEPCPDEIHQTKICRFQVLSVPWKNQNDLVSSSCN
ncbi:cystatin-like [Rana temporaria]|uniref:cystatin-like n=1 Tax=Rana temporaria TaxID=8407 RepID=UPI001AAC93E0|nr:cystatin-like [Rana temporaria]